jgi:hypothetical protein
MIDLTCMTRLRRTVRLGLSILEKTPGMQVIIARTYYTTRTVDGPAGCRLDVVFSSSNPAVSAPAASAIDIAPEVLDEATAFRRRVRSITNIVPINRDPSKGWQEDLELRIAKDGATLTIEHILRPYDRMLSWHPARIESSQKRLVTRFLDPEPLSAHRRIALAKEPERILDLIAAPEPHRTLINPISINTDGFGTANVELDPAADVLALRSLPGQHEWEPRCAKT